jgi:hypothetical protein
LEDQAGAAKVPAPRMQAVNARRQRERRRRQDMALFTCGNPCTAEAASQKGKRRPERLPRRPSYSNWSSTQLMGRHDTITAPKCQENHGPDRTTKVALVSVAGITRTYASDQLLVRQPDRQAAYADKSQDFRSLYRPLFWPTALSLQTFAGTAESREPGPSFTSVLD